MRKTESLVFHAVVGALLGITLFALAFVIFFIIREALPIFGSVSVSGFLFGRKWMPVDMVGTKSFGIFHYIAATIYVSFLALFFASVIGIGSSLFLSVCAPAWVRKILYPVINLLAGIPSVIYGFMGLEILNPLFMRAGVHTGNCILAAGVLLSVMLLPFIIESVSESMRKLSERYAPSVRALGISRPYAAFTLILPAASRSILLALILAVGRAMGETMAVMMVIGNANLFPHLLGKGETIAALIALEMGSAEAGSDHYHALFAAGLILLIILFAINLTIGLIRQRIFAREEV